MRNLTASHLFAFAALLFCAPSWSQSTAIQDRTRLFLDAYAKGDRQTVLNLVDHTHVTMYGSDVAEVVHGADALLNLIDSDQKLWGGTAHMGPMDHVTITETKGLATIFFDVAFSVGGRPPIPVRVAAVWKREGKSWLLIQSSNSVVTEHQSAEDLLRHP
jgi:hypothetical protein